MATTEVGFDAAGQKNNLDTVMAQNSNMILTNQSDRAGGDNTEGRCGALSSTGGTCEFSMIAGADLRCMGSNSNIHARILGGAMDTHLYARQAERMLRATETPIVDGLPDFPGILAAMMISPNLATPLSSLADTLLVKSFPGATLTRSERELIATGVSAGNACFYCMDTQCRLRRSAAAA
ncbi:hypothetical protein [Mesorhizobium sp. M0040]|uniref:hypothetical protein n=1 Tax=Mesorhizobium sp. M0040 TaxID=2956855 RepID=UPI00333727CB